ncbi:MAG: LysR family transcriptional regulator [Tabrizicola sp.]|nr:LysR family transcriptional regulator [Tabrizicola sp.]
MMLEVNQRRLRYFHAVVTHGSIRKAALEMNTAPSVLTRQIRLLEEEIGVTLFDRSAGGSVPTEASQLLMDYWNASRSLVELLDERIAETNSLRRGNVHISLSETFLDDFIDNVLVRFNLDYPNIGVTLNVRSIGEIVQEIETDSTHLGVVCYAPATPSIDVLESANVPMSLLVGTDHPLTRHVGPITLREALQFPLAMMPLSFGLGRMIEFLADAEKVPPNVIFSSNSIRAIIRFVRNGSAVTIIAASNAEKAQARGGVLALPIEHAILNANDAQILAKAGRTPTRAMTAMLDYIRSHSETFAANRAANSRQQMLPRGLHPRPKVAVTQH